MECVTEYLANAGRLGQSAIPYRKWNSLSDFVIDGVLPDKATIGIVGDWGTGGPRAATVLQQIAAQAPDIFIHLGDIYYSGSAEETQENFQAVCDQILPTKTRRFTLAGNHDMYSGGAPYYALLDKIGQPASFFCLRNANWQLLAMDTGYNDFNPLNVNQAITSLRQDAVTDEAAWHLDKIQNSGGRKNIVMSHHQLFSATAICGKAVNGKLLNQLGGVLNQIALWVWGHEHSHIIFNPYSGLTRGRCIGASAIPVPTDDPSQDPYRSTVPNAPTFSGVRLGKDATGRLYSLGYAILKLDGANATLNHYDYATQAPILSEAIS